MTRAHAPTRRALLAAGAGLLAAPAAPVLAAGDIAAGKPITLLVSYPAGGGADVMARLIAPRMAEALGQPVVVENKPGASGTLAAAQVARGPVDGSLLLLDASSYAVNPALFDKLPYEPATAFAPLGVLALFPNVLVCTPGFEARTLADVLRLARAQPGKLAYASSGNGSAQHLAGALFEAMARVEMLHIPYRGGGPALNDVMGGQVPLFFANLASSLGHIQSGRLRALAVSSRLRSRVLPDLPSLDEAGLKGYEVLEWNPLLAPAGVPAPVRARLAAALRKAMAEPELLGRVRALGGEVFGGGEAEAGGFLKQQQALWARVVRERRITRE
ncbi:tripartite tricarboxylate transporter substrate binding protein [Aquabacterium sp. OR-4]|uniref:tripartite tricarboxylate transporter substrate binding protein n=1 Tax=Aquabacterium sp. OR-4 TaxID=2978127 RepID=UPI0028C71EB1|nr:tripartite tricarboxylate transporter substrate binding protein [Aquabacterium sp. OR-4]MDT7838656.1 tripartite tricarboxylate transporter substrate binding protein [Aquabacterium sp. OR-4]